jgi:hypothetical protein
MRTGAAFYPFPVFGRQRHREGGGDLSFGQDEITRLLQGPEAGSPDAAREMPRQHLKAQRLGGGYAEDGFRVEPHVRDKVVSG